MRVVLFQECLSEANIINNQNPLVWGHLTLLALRTGRESEATLVYKEALKLGLSDVPLLRSIGEQQLALGKYTLVIRTAHSNSPGQCQSDALGQLPTSVCCGLSLVV